VLREEREREVDAEATLSTMEAEYISVSATSQEVIWGRTFLRELGFEQEKPTIIFEDNKSCIDISTSYKQHSGAKHIDLRYHFIRDRVLNSVLPVHVQWIFTVPTDSCTLKIKLSYQQKAFWIRAWAVRGVISIWG
jgi:hypothetical protein